MAPLALPSALMLTLMILALCPLLEHLVRFLVADRQRVLVNQDVKVLRTRGIEKESARGAWGGCLGLLWYIGVAGY